MASGKSDFAENKILDAVFGAALLGAPGTWYVALFTAAPSDAGGGTEATGGGYARLAVPNTTGAGNTFNNAAGGLKENAIDFVWPVSTGAWSAGAPIVAAAFFDAATGGNMWYWGDILAASQQAITAANQQFVLRAGDVDITED